MLLLVSILNAMFWGFLLGGLDIGMIAFIITYTTLLFFYQVGENFDE